MDCRSEVWKGLHWHKKRGRHSSTHSSVCFVSTLSLHPEILHVHGGLPSQPLAWPWSRRPCIRFTCNHASQPRKKSAGKEGACPSQPVSVFHRTVVCLKERETGCICWGGPGTDREGVYLLEGQAMNETGCICFDREGPVGTGCICSPAETRREGGCGAWTVCTWV